MTSESINQLVIPVLFSGMLRHVRWHMSLCILIWHAYYKCVCGTGGRDGFNETAAYEGLLLALRATVQPHGDCSDFARLLLTRPTNQNTSWARIRTRAISPHAGPLHNSRPVKPTCSRVLKTRFYNERSAGSVVDMSLSLFHNCIYDQVWNKIEVFLLTKI